MNVKLQEKMDIIIHNPWYKISYFERGNFTVCLIRRLDTDVVENVVGVGIAKRNPNCDEHSPWRAREISFSRAAKEVEIK